MKIVKVIRSLPAIALAFLLAACNSEAANQVPNGATEEVGSVSEGATGIPDGPDTTTPTLPPLPAAKIGIRDNNGAGEFYFVETSERFVPRGHNLVFLRGDATLDSPLSPEIFDPAWTREQLAEMAHLGFNVIRVMFEICSWELCVADSNERVRDEFLDNATELLQIASEEGIFVWYTSNDLPPDSYYAREAFAEGESDFLTPRNVEVYQEYYSDILSGLVERKAPTDWLMAFDIRNEYVYQLTSPPFTMTEGFFTAANGQTYNMADPDQVNQLSMDGILHWANEMTRSVKAILPDVLVTMATLTPNDRIQVRGDDDPRWVVVGDFFNTSDLDFHNIHGMSGDPDGLREEYLIEGEAKPIVTGEFGPGFGFATIDVAAYNMAWWQTMSCLAGFDGWLTWHWLGDNGRFPVKDTMVVDALAPSLHPDPCNPVEVELVNLSWRVPATASATEPQGDDDYGPNNVTDGNFDTWWSAGAGPPQWLELDLGHAAPVGRIKIPIGFLTPAGFARIEVTGRGPDEDDPAVVLHNFEEEIAEGVVLEAVLEEPVESIRYIRFNFLDMNGWVIIHEVEVHRR